MESHLSRTKYGRAFFRSFMKDGPRMGPMRSWLLVSQIETVVRESPPAVSVHDDGQLVCDLCRRIRGHSTWNQKFEDDNGARDTTCVKYQDWNELESLAEQGCSSCRIFRAAILYDHPSPNALELLELDKNIIKVGVKVDTGKATGLTIYYPCKTSQSELDDFMVDPTAFHSGTARNLIVPVPKNVSSEHQLGISEEGTASLAETVAGSTSGKPSDAPGKGTIGAPSAQQHRQQKDDPKKTLYNSQKKPITSPIYRLSSTQSLDVDFLPGDDPHVSLGKDITSPTTSPNDNSDLNTFKPTFPENQTVKYTLESILEEVLPDYNDLMEKEDTAGVQEQRQEIAKAYGDYCGPNRWFLHDKITDMAISKAPLDVPMIVKLMMWMGTCLLSHPQCDRSHHESRMPTRLVDLGDHQTPLKKAHVIKTRGSRMPYSCLSYCWGGDSRNHCRLLRSNVQQLQGAIFSQSVPKTVRDAMWISKAIGVRYIWIDALCIVQDDDVDWRAQAPWMGQFYGNAVVTIAATSSEHADMGMFKERVVERYELQPCKIFGQIPQRPLPHTHRHFTSAPINQRAWTMQELYLSRRIIHMTDASAAWECYTHKGVEFSPADDASDMFPYSEIKEIFRSEPDDAEIMYEAWHAFVTEYSSKSMTKQDDILVAVSSLAEIVSKRTQDDYLAGLWRANLVNDLLWQTDESRSRSKVYSAPSWSWASTHGSGVDSIRFLDPGPAETTVEINEATVEYLDSNPKSKALSGHLGITGRIAEAEICFDQSWAAFGGEGLIIVVDGFNQSCGDFTFDDSAMITTNRFGDRMRTTDTQLYCLALTRKSASMAEMGLLNGWIKGLVLEKDEETAGDDVYRRVGFASLDWVLKKADTFEGREMKCITIL
ncbi:uncharacterized protein CTRU02_207262 [Colletotrichum truncatum]|uniref:Uncharacterized protein n=1 Tax=Colletotrichum truncatum TaxID=5467 RepID=A0ACC3Z0C5_COLTU|nr:uncharacterized protein CTRU02_01102 [Colletotrichum truncatum]KAF6800697.1 hypothetical protein CTRU02_01102 [Colletotrichum truncatum]